MNNDELQEKIMYFGIGSMLAQMAYEGSRDEMSRALWSTVNTVICAAATAQNVKATVSNAGVASTHLNNIAPGVMNKARAAASTFRAA